MNCSQSSSIIGVLGETKHRSQRFLRPRTAIGKQPARKVRVALLHDRIVLINRQAYALQGREGSSNVQHIRRQGKEFSVSSAHLFHDICDPLDIDALLLELRFHLFHHLGSGC